MPNKIIPKKDLIEEVYKPMADAFNRSLNKPQMPELIGVSSITTACESMKHYHWAKVLGKREETPALLEGIQLHQLILEPEKFYAAYCSDGLEPPPGKRILKTSADFIAYLKSNGYTGLSAMKREELLSETLKRQKRANDESILVYDVWLGEFTLNRLTITKVKWDMLHRMRESVLEHAFTKKYLPDAKLEFPIEGIFDGQKIRGRVDWLVDDPKWPYVICIDIKKTKSAKFFKFRSQLYDKWYFVQAALYTKMLEQTYNRPVLHVWLAVEGAWPYIAEAYLGNDAMIEAGLCHASDVLKRLRMAYETNTWTGYTAGLVTNIDIPSFGYDKAADLDDNDGHEEI